MIVNSNQPLDAVVLQSIPTLHAEHAWSGVSSKYAFLSTGKVIEALASEGIRPYSVKTSRTKDESRREYTKHLMRFRPTDAPKIVGGVHPEVVLTNSHDRGSSFAIELGLFRLVCGNGMVVSSGVFESYRVRHVGATIEDVMQAVHSIVGQFPQVEDSVRRMQGVTLSDSQRDEFAQLAVGLRYPNVLAPFGHSRLLSTRRMEDRGTDLWSTYNVIQENLLQGQHGTGSRYYRSHDKAIRAIKSIDADLSINRGLWALAEQYATA